MASSHCSAGCHRTEQFLYSDVIQDLRKKRDCRGNEPSRAHQEGWAQWETLSRTSQSTHVNVNVACMQKPELHPHRRVRHGSCVTVLKGSVWMQFWSLIRGSRTGSRRGPGEPQSEGVGSGRGAHEEGMGTSLLEGTQGCGEQGLSMGRQTSGWSQSSWGRCPLK
jgi:hypothetical protein